MIILEIWSILAKVTWSVDKNVYHAVVRWNILRHPLGPFDLLCHLVLWFLYWFFCVDDLSIGDRGLLKSPTTTVLESICSFKSFNVCLMKLGALILGAYRLIVISFWCIAPFISLKYIDQCKFEVYFFWYKYCYFCLFSGDLGLVNLLPSFHPKSVLISVNKMDLL
jgi:hypothetical protein